MTPTTQNESRTDKRCASCGTMTKPENRRMAGWVYLTPSDITGDKTPHKSRNIAIHLCRDCLPEPIKAMAIAKRKLMRGPRRGIQRERVRYLKSRKAKA